MKKPLKITLIVAGIVIGLALLTHVIINYVVPFMMRLHGAPVY